jgi:hypothetical protein
MSAANSVYFQKIAGSHRGNQHSVTCFRLRWKVRCNEIGTF